MDDQKICDNNQFIISYELLELFKWLIIHEQDLLKKLVDKALVNGLSKRLDNIVVTNIEKQDTLQNSMLDFLLIFDTILYESIYEDQSRKVTQSSLMPDIKKIDSITSDNNSLAFSIFKATSKVENNPSKNPKDILCKEILRRWKPRNLSNLN